MKDTQDNSTNIILDKVHETSSDDTSDKYAGTIENGVEVVDVKNLQHKKKI